MKKSMLIVLDGWGIRAESKDNAVKLAKTPNFDKLWNENPHTTLHASGEHVGLPKGYIGNSEVGHMHLGAGRLVPQELLRINKSISNKSFFKNKVILKAMNRVKRKKKALHLMGLLSDAGVHSHMKHLFALLDMAKKNKVPEVYIHCFLDGRDTPPKSAQKYITQLNAKCKKIGLGSIATIMGRFYAMDRDNRWNREHKAYSAMIEGHCYVYSTPNKALKAAYDRGETDEFVKPTIISKDAEKKDGAKKYVKEGDSIIFFNFREDRARELTRAFVEGRFKKFKRKKIVDIDFVCLTQYDSDIKAEVAFKPEVPKQVLGEVLSKKGLRQLRIAETEKYAHVTFFFNGGKDGPFPLEDRKLIHSPHVSTYDKMPSMSAFKLTEEVDKQLKSDKYDFVMLNFANPDMVAHSGDLHAAIRAIEVVDTCLAKVVYTARKKGYSLLIVADHGNAEEMSGEHMTSHTTNKVPCILLSDDKYAFVGGKKDGISQVSSTILKLMGVTAPKVYAKPLLK